MVLGLISILQKKEYDQHFKNQAREDDLRQRIRDLHSSQFNLSPEAVTDLLAVLDRHGIS
jgi:hypothetical protein